MTAKQTQSERIVCEIICFRVGTKNNLLTRLRARANDYAHKNATFTPILHPETLQAAQILVTSLSYAESELKNAQNSRAFTIIYAPTRPHTIIIL